jgi:hypothetical protein
LQNSLLALSAYSEELGLGAESSGKVVGSAVAKTLGAAGAMGATYYDYKNGADRYTVVGDVGVGVGAFSLAFPEDVALGGGWLALKNYPGGPVGYAQAFSTWCSSSPEACGN